MLSSCFRLDYAVKLGERILICGPAGSGKGHLAKEGLRERVTFITYGDLLSSTVNFYESPRQRLTRLLETALVKGEPVILGNLEELCEEPGLWLSITLTWFARLQQAKLPLICTINSDNSKVFNLVKDHFLHIMNVPKRLDHKIELRYADLQALERESQAMQVDKETVLDKMIFEGRTCSQLSNNSTSGTFIETKEVKTDGTPTLTLETFYGVDEEVKKLLLGGAQFTKGTKGPRGALLYGPPGTGKTRLALALAGSLGNGTRFISLTSADLLRAEIGTSEVKLKEAFSLAKSSQPALIFFDEIDALFPENPSIHLLSLQHQLVAEFDAIEREQQLTGKFVKIFLLAASNHLKKISKRILTVDRFEEQIEISLPDYKGRLDILRNDLLKKDTNLSDDFIQMLARKTENKSPAELTKIVQDARKNSWKRVNENSLLIPIDFDFLK